MDYLVILKALPYNSFQATLTISVAKSMLITPYVIVIKYTEGKNFLCLVWLHCCLCTPPPAWGGNIKTLFTNLYINPSCSLSPAFKVIGWLVLSFHLSSFFDAPSQTPNVSGQCPSVQARQISWRWSNLTCLWLCESFWFHQSDLLFAQLGSISPASCRWWYKLGNNDG